MKTRLYIIRIIVAFFLSFFAITSVAQAQSFTFAADSDLATPQITEWLATAQNFWGAYPNCPQGVTVQLWETPTPVNALAKATVGGCKMSISARWINNDMKVSKDFHTQVMCNGITHEYGHLLGYGHVHDPKNIMHENVQFLVPECQNEQNKYLTGTSPSLVEPFEDEEGEDDNISNVMDPLPNIDADYWVHNVSSSKPTIKVTIFNFDRKRTAKLTVCVPWGKNKVLAPNYKKVSYAKSRNCYRTHVKGKKTLTFQSRRLNNSRSMPRLQIFAMGEKLIG